MIFSDDSRDPDDAILGIESSFDDSAACAVNSYGELISENVKYTKGVSEKIDFMGVDPKLAEQHHLKWLPVAVE